MGRTIQAKGFCFVEGTANRFYYSAQTNVLDSNERFKGSKLQKGNTAFEMFIVYYIRNFAGRTSDFSVVPILACVLGAAKVLTTQNYYLCASLVEVSVKSN